MPWLSRQQSSQNSANESVTACSPTGSRDMHQHHCMGRDIPITFIPAQIDGMCGTTAPCNVQMPMSLMREQCMAFVRSMSCMPTMMRSLFSMGMMKEYMRSPMACRDLMLQCCLGMMQMCMMMAMVPVMMTMPGIMVMMGMMVCWMMVMMCMWPLNKGERVMKMIPQGMTMREGEECADECWIYVNGMMTRYVSPHLQSTKRTDNPLATIP